jgi:hypothetical protein
MKDFAIRLSELEARMKAQADADGDVYVPCPRPVGPVDAVLVGMEPSWSWAGTREKAGQRLAAGFLNFIEGDLHMWVLRHCARRAFGSAYHLTDFSKGAMPVAHANAEREARYGRWASLLREELELVAKPGAPIVAIGKDVRAALLRHGLPAPSATVLHYSPLASRHRADAVVGLESEFEKFSLSLGDVVSTAEVTLREFAVSAALADAALARLRRKKLSDSLRMLAFHYKTAFVQPLDRAAREGLRQ